jgi:hypothetical protein
VAANIIASGDGDGDGDGRVYDPVPYSWSEQFGRTMQYAGYHAAADRLLWRGPAPDATDPEPWTACWLSGDRLVALLAVDRPRDLLQARRVIAAGTPVDPDRLTDPAVPVKNATRS